LNRIDETILFDRLSETDLSQIVTIQIAHLDARLASQKLHLHLSDAVRTLLAEEGYDPVYGARPLKRTVQRRLLDPLSLALLEGRFKEGDHIHAETQNGTITFETEAKEDVATQNAETR
jgi:ATP-dependent Clp protease ATP-binding subunit ClpB